MKGPRVNIIAAIGNNNELGKCGKLVWKIHEDLKRFRALTTGHPVIMGLKTYDSIGKPLPNRINIVVSKSTKNITGCIVAPSLEKALEEAVAYDSNEIFVIGGSHIYECALPYAHRLYLTRIDASDNEADTFFPRYDDFTKIVARSPIQKEGGLAFEWVSLERP